MADIETRKIIQLMREGNDKAAISTLYKKVLPLVKNYISKNNGRKDDANDVFQDALVVLYEQIMKGTFNEKYNIFGYLYKLSLFRWINFIKKEKTISYVEELPEIQLDETYERWGRPEVLEKELNVLERYFANIGDKCIELLSLAIFTEVSSEDVMLRMGFASVDATRMQQMRCKQKLMKEIEKNPSLLDKLRNI